MRLHFTSLALAVTFALSSLTAFAQSSAQTERVATSFVLALGRVPTAAEIVDAEKLGHLSISELVAKHRQHLQSDPALKRATVIKAWKDAFGREPSESEIADSTSGNATYTELMQRHIQYLKKDPAEYEKVMERAYRLVIRRGVYPGEIEYWKKRETLSYALLVGCVEDWGRRNAPGLMETAGTPTVSVNSNYLETVRLEHFK
jgi:hypothetical protein